MSDLSPIADNQCALETLKTQIIGLERSVTGGRKKPHKLVLLLIVLDLFESDPNRDNQIEFDSDLEAAFENVLLQFGAQDDRDHPSSPFFYLKTSPFWNLRPVVGKEVELSKLKKPGGGRAKLNELVDYAYLSETAVGVFRDRVARSELRGFVQGILRTENRNR